MKIILLLEVVDYPHVRFSNNPTPDESHTEPVV
jgi:hypothetical protein